MADTVETRLKIDSWDEKPYRELSDGRKFTRAEVALSGSGDELESATFDGLMFYRADGTSSYVTLMHINATLGGRSGTFVLQGHGSFDGTTARGESTVVAGSGTAGLVAITGIAESASTHEDYPFMPLTLRYELE